MAMCWLVGMRAAGIPAQAGLWPRTGPCSPRVAWRQPFLQRVLRGWRELAAPWGEHTALRKPPRVPGACP